jgi:hypothetical protein
MEGLYLPINDGEGIIGYAYVCPQCHSMTAFVSSDDGCGACEYHESHVDPDDWYEQEMSKPIKERAWNSKYNATYKKNSPERLQ